MGFGLAQGVGTRELVPLTRGMRCFTSVSAEVGRWLRKGVGLHAWKSGKLVSLVQGSTGLLWA